MKDTHKLNRVISLVVVVILGSMTTANAALITDSNSYGPIDVGDAAGWAGASLPKFDSSLGTLTQVTLILDANTFAGGIAWDNEAGVASDVTLGIGAEVTINALGTLAAIAIPLQTGSSSVTADEPADGDGDFAGTDSFQVVGGSGSDSDANSSTDAGVLTSFTGAGTFDVWLSSSLQTLVSTSGGWGPSTTMTGDTDGTVTITYEYTPIPEPATMALLGLGSVVLRRKRRL